MLLCPNCRLNGFCQRNATRLVTNRELENAEFIRDVRETAFDEGKQPHEWLEHLGNLYRDYNGWVRGADGKEVFLDMEEFERSHIEDWFDRFCCTSLPAHIAPRLKECSRERVRIIATILRTQNPARALMWGIRASNDNRPPQNT